MRYRALFLVVVGLLVCCLAYADIPRLINFQGRLTDSSGKFVVDGNYSVTFSIYSVPSGGSALWSETQSVSVSKGLFNVILGSNTPIPNSIFDSYVDTYLGVQVGADAEMTPRQRISSLGYAYYSLNADKLDGLDASDFTSPVSDYGRSGVSPNLYEGTSTLTDKYVNEQGPEIVYSASGSAFSGTVSDSSINTATGVYGYAENKGSGVAYGVRGDVNEPGSGGQHYGLVGVSHSASSSVSYTSGALGEGYADGSGWALGVIGLSNNNSDGPVYAGYFEAYSGGTGERYGVEANAYSSSDATAYGISGYAQNTSTGVASGGFFSTSSSGTGEHYGIEARGYGASSTQTFGVQGYASNTSTGNAYAGYFTADSAGTGDHYGIMSYGLGDQSADAAYGVYGYAKNSSSASAFGGYFSTSSDGTGYHYGIYAAGWGSNSSGIYGTASDAYNYSDGEAYGGIFYASSMGSGTRYGVFGEAFSNSDSSAYGVYGYGSNYVTGNAYGGFFETSTSGTGYHYGVRAEGNSSTTGLARGVYAMTENTSSGSAYGGYFYASSSGTGGHRGVVADAYGSSSSSTYGFDAFVSNYSSGSAYGGYFAAYSTSGTEYGVYSYAPSTGYAGYFSGDFLATGTKSAAVKVDNGEYRLLYAMESPENWFEDFGGGTLQNGVATVQIDPLFAQSVNTQIEYRVFLTPEGDCKGLYVDNKASTSFEVRELQGGTSNISFSYRIVAKRKGYEELRMAKMVGSTPEEIEAEHARRVAESEQEMAQMKRERIERTEEDELKNRPQPIEIESVQKVRREEPRPEDTEKIRVKMESRK